jgi:hypothetical protein
MNSTKLKGDLQQVLGSLGQFLLININFFKFSHWNLHLLKFVRIPIKEKILSISNWDSTMSKICQTRNLTIVNIDSCFCLHCKTILFLSHPLDII